MKLKAFTTDRRAARHHVMVESDGSVLVYDPVAGYYTRLHSMSERSRKRALKLAEMVTP